MTRFDELAYPAAESLLDGEPVVLLPVGSTEPHGPHAPLCTDTLISVAMCRRAAQALEGEVQTLLLPPVPFGVTRYAAEFPGAVGVSEETVRALVRELCESLIDQGFGRVVVVNNHLEPEHLRALHGALDDVEASRGVIVGFLDLTRGYRASALPDEFRAGEAHAGRYETSIVLAERPELVDARRMGSLPRVAVDMASAIAGGRRDFLAMGMDQAYCGSPAEATAEEGEASLGALTEMLVEVVREVVGGHGGRDRPGRGSG